MKKIIKWLDVNAEPVIMSFLFYAMTLLVTLQVILRFGFQSGFSWGEEVARFIFVWLMFISFSYVTRSQRHIKVTFIAKKLSEKAQKVLMILNDFLFLGFMLSILVAGIKVTQSVVKYGDMAVTIKVSMNIIYGAGLVGFIFMAIRIIQSIIWKFKNFSCSIEKFENYGGVYNGANDICFFFDKQKIDEDKE